VKLPIAGLIIIMLLVWQFNSLRKSLIVLTTIPLALIGVVIGLLVMDSYFGFMTFLGVISLAGIVINNAIVLLERIQLEIDENGLPPQRAIIEAAQRRLRPILLTTATTIASLIPLYLGGGIMFEPMAVAIMFGLAFSTVLTLGFVPLLYALLFRVKFRGQEAGAAAT
jgi:multidrug efflux pump subunit AcrB